MSEEGVSNRQFLGVIWALVFVATVAFLQGVWFGERKADSRRIEKVKEEISACDKVPDFGPISRASKATGIPSEEIYALAEECNDAQQEAVRP